MNIDYDNIANALYIRLRKAGVAKTVELSDRLIADLDKDGNVLGIEMLNVSQQLKKKSIPSFVQNIMMGQVA
jgi:uncharacterized protein YuzE